jgi:hypothetical protein
MGAGGVTQPTAGALKKLPTPGQSGMPRDATELVEVSPGSPLRGNHKRQITRTKEASKGEEPSSKRPRFGASSFGAWDFFVICLLSFGASAPAEITKDK